jgi:L-lactate dehydrogenase complex protein LldG
VSSRERILGRVRRALADVPREEVPYERAVVRDYLREHGGRTVEETVDLLAENLADYRAIVHRCTADDLAATIAGILSARGVRTVLVPPGLDAAWLAASGAERVPDRAESTPHELDRVDSVVTACTVAIAETGTIVLDGGPDQGRRRITLVPDHHVCDVVVPEQVVSSVPQALERLDPVQLDVTGRRRTGDPRQRADRVEGVHGPRTLEVVLVAGQPSADVTSQRPDGSR